MFNRYTERSETLRNCAPLLGRVRLPSQKPLGCKPSFFSSWQRNIFQQSLHVLKTLHNRFMLGKCWIYRHANINSLRVHSLILLLLLTLLVFSGSLPRLRARLLRVRRPRRQPREELEPLGRQLRLAQPPARNLAQRHRRRGFFPEFEPYLPEFCRAADGGPGQPVALDDAGVIVEGDCRFQKKDPSAKCNQSEERNAFGSRVRFLFKIGCIGKI